MKSLGPCAGWGLVLACGLLGCAPSVDYLAMRTPSRELRSRPASAVEVFYYRGPDRPFTEVGLLEAVEGASGAGIGRQKLVDALRERAGAIGCDAILIVGPSDTVTACPNVSLAGLAPGSVPEVQKGFEASCLVFDGS